MVLKLGDPVKLKEALLILMVSLIGGAVDLAQSRETLCHVRHRHGPKKKGRVLAALP